MAFFLWMTRSQTKKQKELESTLKTGDRVVTRAGIVGKVSKVGETTFELELAPGVHVTFLKSAVEGLHEAKGVDATKKAEAKGAGDKPKSDKDAKDKA
jgi:preprotein translocase subunit YajC